MEYGVLFHQIGLKNYHLSSIKLVTHVSQYTTRHTYAFPTPQSIVPKKQKQTQQE